MSRSPVKRNYDNSRRAARARETRRAILQAGHDCFIETGYHSTTIPMVAARAGVSVDSIHKHFGTKAALAREVLDVTIAGDDEPVPMAERQQANEIAEARTAPDMLRRYAVHARGIHERLGRLAAVLLFGARAGDVELRDLTADADAQRLHAASLVANGIERRHGLGAGVTRAWARDVIWVLNSPEVHWLLTAERRWSEDDYERLLGDALVALLLRPDEPTATPRST